MKLDGFWRIIPIALFWGGAGLIGECWADRPNILWIVVEDASPNLGAYGETAIKTPHLDQLAQQGIQFQNAFVTCPVCSPSRSAMVTGIYQTTLGAHQHRSQSSQGKGRAGEEFWDSYRLPVDSIPRLFQKAGYYTSNSKNGKPNGPFGKTDYNFIWERSDYDGADWNSRKAGQPFFAQVQLSGGKNRQARRHADPDQLQLPKYYANHPTLRKDWAKYLDSWVKVDLDVQSILNRLQKEGIADETAVFFWTDHGVSHLRGKQFLYEEGIHIPLIVRLPGENSAGTTRNDLVAHVDITATSLALAGIDIPDYVQGRDVLAEGHQPRDVVFSARDRCDETVDIIRSVRTERFKYIRNFLPHLSHAQPNTYKDSKSIVNTMRRLHQEEQLDQLQSRPFVIPRPSEELYDLLHDPLETSNLAGDPEFHATLEALRQTCRDWMIESRDLGLIPEPILEEMGRAAGNKYFVLQQPQNQGLNSSLWDLIEEGERGNQQVLASALQSQQPAMRYWGATLAGLYWPESASTLQSLLDDSSASVRIAAALALCRLGQIQFSETLADEIDNPNRLVGLYAIRALELSGLNQARRFSSRIEQAESNPYEFTRRIARRLNRRLEEASR